MPYFVMNQIGPLFFPPFLPPYRLATTGKLHNSKALSNIFQSEIRCFYWKTRGRQEGGFWTILIFPPSIPKKSIVALEVLEWKKPQSFFCRSQRLEFNNTLGWTVFFSFTFEIYYLCIHDAFFCNIFFSLLTFALMKKKFQLIDKFMKLFPSRGFCCYCVAWHRRSHSLYEALDWKNSTSYHFFNIA